MRLIGIALGLIWLLPGPLAAWKIEDHSFFPAQGADTLRIVSTTDLAVFEPYIRQFQTEYPDIAVDYTVMASSVLHRALAEGAEFDLAISSAMDLQFQLVNDGFARPYRSDATQTLPDWARWRDLIFAFTTEPAVVVINGGHFADLPLPMTRQELITILRDNPDRFSGAIGTYDVRESGLGYLFATQEDRSTDAYWRLNEVMGRLNPMLYCCSADMIDGVATGQLALAYNVLGSYAAEDIAQGSRGQVQIIRMEDFANAMLRTAIVPRTARQITAAGAMIDMLIGIALRDRPGNWPLPPLRRTGSDQAQGFGPSRLGPALLTYLDPLNRRAFLTEWENAMEQDTDSR